jgi:hypothetical protein
MSQAEEKVVMELTRAEALVLFEWLYTRGDSLTFDDQAEQDVLWRIEGALESTLVEPLQADYAAALEAARKRVKEGPK